MPPGVPGLVATVDILSTDCRSVENATRTALRIPVSAYCVLTSQSLTTIRHSQTEGYAIFFPLRPLPGGRRLAAARTGVSDCAGFAPN